MRATRGSALVAGAAALGLTGEWLARRLAIADLTVPSDPMPEAHWKLRRIDELRAQRRLPDTLLIGASVLDADIDPTVMERCAPELGSVFNACLTGSETDALTRWWQVIRDQVRPARVAIEVHPLMVHGETSMMTEPVNRALGTLPPPSSSPPRSLPSALSLRPGDLRPDRLRGAFKARSVGTSLRTDRNLANGHLHRFRDTPFEEGIKSLPPDWYEVIGIDPWPNPDYERYFAFAGQVKDDVSDVTLVVSPLALNSTTSTGNGHDSYLSYGDHIMDVGASRGFQTIDLRSHFTSAEDFADPFHLRRSAVVRASRLLANGMSGRGTTDRRPT
jgi:hypothetical protein